MARLDYIVIFIAFIASTVWADTITGTVVGISDGDTLTVLDADKVQHKVRLAGIDAPEKRQDFGTISKQSLSDLAYRQQAIVETSTTDRYGRLVGKVVINGLDVNLEQVRRGLAWHYRACEREQAFGDRLAYAAAENAAKAVRAGLWSLPRPIPPWTFRRERRDAISLRAAGVIE